LGVALRPHPRGAAIILWPGWEDKWGTDAYPNLDADGVIHQPGFLLETVEWLIQTRRLDRRGALGTDTFSPDRGIDTDFGVSVALYDRHRISLENLANLGSLPRRVPGYSWAGLSTRRVRARRPRSSACCRADVAGSPPTLSEWGS
jgi:kynurenine formamidase